MGCQYPIVPWQIHNLSQFPGIFCHVSVPRERSFQEKRSRERHLAFSIDPLLSGIRWSQSIVLVFHGVRRDLRARRPLVFFPWLKNQPRVKYIQDSRRRIFNGEIFQHDLRRVGRIYTCVWVRACLKLLALAGPAGAGDAKNPRAKRNGKIHQTALTHLTLRVSLHITSAFRLLYFFFEGFFYVMYIELIEINQTPNYPTRWKNVGTE